jgi:hypothetical protein
MVSGKPGIGRRLAGEMRKCLATLPIREAGRGQKRGGFVKVQAVRPSAMETLEAWGNSLSRMRRQAPSSKLGSFARARILTPYRDFMKLIFAGWGKSWRGAGA